MTAAGFATLPHAVSRMVLVKRPSAAQEHFGWVALFTFIVISTLPLTLEVITSEGDENWQALASRPVVHMLPYLALLLIAVNGFSATMLGFAASLARGVQRSRNRDPGERSMFGTRALAVIAAAALVGAVQRYEVQIELLFPIALGLSASAFFAPLIAANWVGSIVRFFDSAAITAGAFVFAALVLPSLSSGDQLSSPEIVTFAAFGISASFSILLIGKVIGILRPDLAADPTGRIIRGED